MKFMFWNIRGLGKPARRRHLPEIIDKERMDVVGIQETIKKGFSVKDLKALAGKGEFVWLWSAAIGHSGGLLMGGENR